MSISGLGSLDVHLRVGFFRCPSPGWLLWMSITGLASVNWPCSWTGRLHLPQSVSVYASVSPSLLVVVSVIELSSDLHLYSSAHCLPCVSVAGVIVSGPASL